MIEAVFLDAGLTLLYTEPPVERVYAEAFTRYGLPSDERGIGAALHATWREVRERQSRGEERWGGDAGLEAAFWSRFVQSVFTRAGGGDVPDGLLAELVAHFRRNASWRVYDDVLETLATLRAAGLKLLVVSNWDRTLPRLLERLELAPRFDGIVTSAEVGYSKPAREIFEAALKVAGVPAAAALHVGDSSEEDYDGAVGAGLAAFHLDREGKGPAAPHRIVSLAEIPRRLGL